MLSILQHINLVKLVGYCADGDQRLLVYEFMPKGSLDVHLFRKGPNREPLDWNTRMKIALGTARGLEYLHCNADPPVIYRDMKAANILLDEGFRPKLSDFGLAKFGPGDDRTHVSTRVMGTYGYCAPDYASTGKLTVKSDIYSFGVLLLELITGRMALDFTKPPEERELVKWARSFIKRQKISLLADPSLGGGVSESSLLHVVAIACNCLREEPSDRPDIGIIVKALKFVVFESNKWSPKTAHNFSSRVVRT